MIDSIKFLMHYFQILMLRATLSDIANQPIVREVSVDEDLSQCNNIDCLLM